MEFGLVAIACALLAINFNISKLNKTLETIAEILWCNSDDEEGDN